MNRPRDLLGPRAVSVAIDRQAMTIVVAVSGLPTPPMALDRLPPEAPENAFAKHGH
ncbi:hypothetical protein OU426_14450 [Frigidibacter sp. RF13]|uniref:hypothetical protein n=1 Tax=Frigidibacter sp. RF13 TaxID=2997340 RepID=UPI00226EE1FA|nr:hypothetical protein [Frigidibacter sp. RF13]MCY1128061.1 hypothetical protein [Frigidibacter sp. RF13]